MNEDEMQRLFADYRDSLGTCRRVPLPRSGNRVWRPARWALVAIGAVALGGVALWPADATARALRRMRSALQYARTMEMTFEMQRPDGRWATFNRKLYQHGVWRIEDTRTTGLTATYLRKAGEFLVDYRSLGYTVLRPADDSEWTGGDQALDDAIATIAPDREDGTSVRQERHAPVDGAPTYLVVLDQPKNEIHASILVDARDDLPISTEMTQDGVDGTGIRFHHRLRQTYRFNQPLPEALFRPDPRKPIVRLDEAKAALSRRWRAPLAEVGGTKVWDASVASDGTIWLAITTPEIERTFPSPSAILGGRYARLVGPWIQGGNGHDEFSLDGHLIEVIGFTPVDPGGEPPEGVLVAFRGRNGVTVSSKEEDRSPVAATRSLALRQESGDAPAYFTALDLDRFRIEKDILVWEARAKALQGEGRLVDAARAYEACAVAYRHTIRYVGYRPLRQAGECYERAGRGADAARVRSEADALLASRER